MAIITNQPKKNKNQINIKENKVESIKILSEFTRKDIEKSYNLDTIEGAEAYFSNRYGWTLRRTSE